MKASRAAMKTIKGLATLAETVEAQEARLDKIEGMVKRVVADFAEVQENLAQIMAYFKDSSKPAEAPAPARRGRPKKGGQP